MDWSPPESPRVRRRGGQALSTQAHIFETDSECVNLDTIEVQGPRLIYKRADYLEQCSWPFSGWQPSILIL
jgi:hypothetical protein